MASIPEDLIRDILSRSPVKDLLRFRCVSKLFGSLINCPDFIKLHIPHSQNINSNLYGIKSFVRFDNTQFKIFYVSNSVTDISEVMVNRPLGFEPEPIIRCWEVVGSCNGLIALRLRGKTVDHIMFWNPLTGKSKKVASSCIPSKSLIHYGFGYDPKTDDYKLVRIVEFIDAEHHPNHVTLRTWIYSLKADSWKETCKDLLFNCNYGVSQEAGVLANNTLHWGICHYDNGDWKIIALDLVMEEFHYVPLYDCFQYEYLEELGVVDGCLALTCSFGRYGLMWIMKKYCVKESWTTVLSYSCSHYSCSDSEHNDNIYPLAYSSRRDKLSLSCSTSWYWFNLINEKSCPNTINGNSCTEDVKLFTGSLVAPDHGTNMVDLKKQTVLEYI